MATDERRNIERACQIARSGHCRTLDELMVSMAAEGLDPQGFDDRNMRLMLRGLIRQSQLSPLPSPLVIEG